jgi:hypothetical protein
MDDKFAVNPHDRVRAREAIVEAGEQDISFDKYLEMHSAYLTGKGRDAKHIKEQINKVKDLRSYFE